MKVFCMLVIYFLLGYCAPLLFAETPFELPESAIFTYAVERDTLLKSSVNDSSLDKRQQSCRLKAGQQIHTHGPATFSGQNHYSLQVSSITGEACAQWKSGYVYGPDIGILHPSDIYIVLARDSWLKAKIDEPETLSTDEKCFLKAGTVLRLQGRMQLFPGDHYLLKIHPNSRNPCAAMSDGYLLGAAFGMSRPDGVEYRVQQGTWLKLRVEEEKDLAASEKCFIPVDAAIIVAEPLSHAVGNHVLISLRSSSLCSFRTAYVYAPHLGVDFSKISEPAYEEKPSGQVWGHGFVNFYKTNYEAIADKVGFTTNACAAFASTALARYGVEMPYIEWATTVGEYLGYLGWKRISSLNLLQEGDVVFSRDSRSAIDGQSTHVWIFAQWIRKDITAYAIDNQGNMYPRYLNNAGYHDVFWYAYRRP